MQYDAKAVIYLVSTADILGDHRRDQCVFLYTGQGPGHGQKPLLGIVMSVVWLAVIVGIPMVYLASEYDVEPESPAMTDDVLQRQAELEEMNAPVDFGDIFDCGAVHARGVEVQDEMREAVMGYDTERARELRDELRSINADLKANC